MMSRSAGNDNALQASAENAPPTVTVVEPGRTSVTGLINSTGSLAGYVLHSKPVPRWVPPPPPHVDEPVARHGGSDEGQGQSVAELLARLQSGTAPTEGGRRRRRDD